MNDIGRRTDHPARKQVFSAVPQRPRPTHVRRSPAVERALECDMDEERRNLCQRYEAGFMPPEDADKVGISESALRGELPLNGLRHPPESGTTGWFIWSGAWSDDPEFFKPMHLSHLAAACPAALPFLALPPGWRFLVAPGHEDVWPDRDLLDI